jgi:lipid-A-disaccharide synthase-like uncharacterized protein
MLLSTIGWLGVIFCTTGYLLLSIKLITAEHLLFQLLNIVGGLCLVTIALYSNDLPNVVANLLWMFVGLFAAVRQLRSKRKHRRN